MRGDYALSGSPPGIGDVVNPQRHCRTASPARHYTASANFLTLSFQFLCFAGFIFRRPEAKAQLFYFKFVNRIYKHQFQIYLWHSVCHTNTGFLLLFREHIQVILLQIRVYKIQNGGYNMTYTKLNIADYKWHSQYIEFEMQN